MPEHRCVDRAIKRGVQAEHDDTKPGPDMLGSWRSHRTRAEEDLQQNSDNRATDEENALYITGREGFRRKVREPHEKDHHAANHADKISDTPRDGRREQCERDARYAKRTGAQDDGGFGVRHPFLL